jgi:hypothetical protein
MRKGKWMWLAPMAILGVLAFLAIGGAAVMLLWNWLLPTLFGWHQITFWQALGLLALCRILFGGHGFGPSGLRHRMRERMRGRMAARWEGMTPEERERLRQRLHGRCGFEAPASQSNA